MRWWILACGVLSVSCAGPRPLEPLTFQMDWTHEAEYVGFYAAEAQGFFKEAGLAVTLVEGPAGTDIASSLASRADAAQMGAAMFQSAAQTDPDLVAVMAVLQTSPRVLMTMTYRDIRSPRGLEGLKVGIKSPSWGSVVRKVLANAGADPSKLVEVPVRASEIERFYRGEVDVWTGFATSEPAEAELAGHPVNLLFADDFGAGGYDELVVVKRPVLRQNPDLYRRLVRALVRGWSWAADHGDQVVSLLDQRQPQASHAFHELAWKALRPLVVTGRDPVGWIRNDRWPADGGPFTTELLDKP